MGETLSNAYSLEVVEDSLHNQHLPLSSQFRLVRYRGQDPTLQLDVSEAPDDESSWIVRWHSALDKTGVDNLLRDLAQGESEAMLLAFLPGDREARPQTWCKGIPQEQERELRQRFGRPAQSLDELLETPYVFARLELPNFILIWEPAHDDTGAYFMQIAGRQHASPNSAEVLNIQQRSLAEGQKEEGADFLRAAESAWQGYLSSRAS